MPAPLIALTGILACTACKGTLALDREGELFSCDNCGKSYRCIGRVPCFVEPELESYSEVPESQRESFLAMKRAAYGGSGFVSLMYNHYHRYAARKRHGVGAKAITLDIGWGIGEHYPYISDSEKREGRFVGIDLDRFKLEFSSSVHSEIPLLQASAADLPVAGNSVDVVQLLATLEHFSVADMESVLAETLRVLKPGGMLLVSYPAEGGWLLRICQKLMHFYLRIRSGFDLERGDVHNHLATAREIRGVLGGIAELQRIETRYYPFNLPCMHLALFVNEQYRKLAEG